MLKTRDHKSVGPHVRSVSCSPRVNHLIVLNCTGNVGGSFESKWGQRENAKCSPNVVQAKVIVGCDVTDSFLRPGGQLYGDVVKI